MAIKVYTEKVQVPGSKFEEYALLSRLTNNYIIKHLRFIDPVIDDDGNIFPFVRKDHILFIDGIAVSIISLSEFLDEVIDRAYTDYPTSVMLPSDKNTPIKTLIKALEKIEVLGISSQVGAYAHIFPKEESEDSPWSRFFNLINDIPYSKDIEFEDEITDF